jgi:hypothetical protein
MQRKLIGSGSDTLTAALQEKLAPAFKVGPYAPVFVYRTLNPNAGHIPYGMTAARMYLMSQLQAVLYVMEQQRSGGLCNGILRADAPLCCPHES